MADSPKGYRVEDRRRVTARGERIRPPAVPGMRPVDFRRAFRGHLDKSFRYFRAQLEHHRQATHPWPKGGEFLAALLGFTVSSQQLYSGAIKLIADDAPKPLVMPSAILARAMLEGLGNVFALLEDPQGRFPLFLRDDYRNSAAVLAFRLKRYGPTSSTASQARKLAQYASALGLSKREIADPEKQLKRWPTPGGLLGLPNGQPYLSGHYLTLFGELYHFWYAQLSAYAHHRIAALQGAIFTEVQPDEVQFVHVKTAITTLALLVSVCVLSEVETYCKFDACIPLRAAWDELRGMHDLMQTFYQTRYRDLLRMPPG